MWQQGWLFLFAINALTAAFPVVHETRDLHTADVHRKIAIHEDAIIRMRIGLVQSNLDRGYEYLMEVSDPGSERYGQHWTLDEVANKFAPSSESADAVQTWLRDSGIGNAQQTSNKGWIAFEATAGQVNRLFGTTYQEYHDEHDGSMRVGCDEYSIPGHLALHIDMVQPAVKLSPPVQRSIIKRAGETGDQILAVGPLNAPPSTGPWQLTPEAASLPPDVQKCAANITPPCLRALYGIPPPGNLTISPNSIGVFEYGDTYAQEDLDLFFAKYAQDLPQGTHPEAVLVNNASGPGNIGAGETDVDLDIIYSLLGPAPLILYNTQPVTPEPTNYVAHNSTLVDPFLDAIDGSYCDEQDRAAGYQCGGTILPKVVSISYSLPELYVTSFAAQQRACNEFLKLSLQGHTFVVASGDFGVAGNPQYGSFATNSNGCVPSTYYTEAGLFRYNGPVFSPQFPANCPYVLTVGGTMMLSNTTVLDKEVVASDPMITSGTTAFSSGGGFSNIFSRPSYQEAAVTSYFKCYDPGYKTYTSNGLDASVNNKSSIGSNGGIYNVAGRGYPDVSANGYRFQIFHNGSEEAEIGTSLAAPVWASILTMINQERSNLGKGPVGFVNPALYQNPQVFNDITSGNNAGCGTPGFPAVSGWDPSTGLGTPKYLALSLLFANLP